MLSRWRKVPRWTFSRKALLIVALLAVFQLILLGGLFAIERAHDRERQTELRRKEAVASAYRLLALLIDTETAMRGYLLTENPEFLQPYGADQGVL